MSLRAKVAVGTNFVKLVRIQRSIKAPPVRYWVAEWLPTNVHLESRLPHRGVDQPS